MPTSISMITMSIILLENTFRYIFLRILRLLLNSRSDSISLALVLSKVSLCDPRSVIISFPVIMHNVSLSDLTTSALM